jgi:hypothetical protein
MIRKIDFEGLEPLWCSHCDGVLVDPSDSSTGSFYSVFGHPWTPRCGPSEPGKLSDDYRQVVFSLCPACEKSFSLTSTPSVL